MASDCKRNMGDSRTWDERPRPQKKNVGGPRRVLLGTEIRGGAGPTHNGCIGRTALGEEGILSGQRS